MAAAGVAQPPPAQDLTQSSLEDLMNIQVTTVSKKEQKLARAGAAVFVITQEDIRRSGATSVPDVLRLAPGVDVARIDANAWAISIRGFNDRFANKVLVLVDGRSVYDPVFSGTFWDAQDVPLEDIERIEVIRGPGGTVWGANAVNGVINIITKNAKDTPGGLISAGGGSETTADGLLQYGFSGPKGAYRVFGKYFNIESSVLPNGSPAVDGGHGMHGGFRSDWDLSQQDTMTVQGDFQRLNEGQTYTTLFSNALPLTATLDNRIDMTSGNVLGRWAHTLNNGSEMSLQVYDDYIHLMDQGVLDSHNTVDLEFEHHLTLGSRNDIVWGLGSRVTDGHFGNGYSIRFSPLSRTDLLFSTFAQDEIQIAGNLWLTVGSKFEHNSYTGFEYEPSAQLVWTPAQKHALWLSAARAIRQPSPTDVGVALDLATVPVTGFPFGVLRVRADPGILAETLNDYEAGYRAQLNKRLSLDVAAFMSFYRDLTGFSPQAPYIEGNPRWTYLVLPMEVVNNTRLRTYGTEIYLSWNPTKRWQISPGYSWIHMAVNEAPGSGVATGQQFTGNTPQHQLQVRSLLNLSHRLEWDNTVGYVSSLINRSVPAYTRLDSRVGWHWGESWDLSVVGQNLLTPRHAEFPDEYGLNHTLLERSVFGRFTWRF